MNVDDIRKDEEHVVTNIWIIKKRGTLSIFYVEQKPENNNRDIYEVRSLLNCRIKFEPPHPE